MARVPAFVGKLMQEQDGDVFREGVRVLAPALSWSGPSGHERTEEPTRYRNESRTQSWDTRVGTIELEGADRQLLPVPAAAAAPGRRGAAGRRLEGLRPRGTDAKGRRAGQRPGTGPDLEVAGVADVPGAGHGGRTVPDAAADRGVPLHLF